MTKKKRSDIPKEIAAKILFDSDRTCCVCRIRNKPVQIHHIDDNPDNHEISNLAVLCFDCHRETQIRGGFDRKLDGEQIILYRDNWHQLVTEQRRVDDVKREAIRAKSDNEVEIATSIAEIYRENEEYEFLAVHYHYLGNNELRDKYIDLAIEQEQDDDLICYLRGLQGRGDKIPPDVIERKLSMYEKHKDWSQRARFFVNLGRKRDAAADYVRSVLEDFETNNIFAAAYYLKELFEEGLVDDLFIQYLKEATDRGDLWWQIRCLEELGWYTELDELLISHESDIVKSNDIHLQLLLADAKGETEKSNELRKERARETSRKPPME